jgi:Ca2+-binding RTX toxin-like protein
VATINGTVNDDILEGTVEDDVIYGGEGNDQIAGDIWAVLPDTLDAVATLSDEPSDLLSLVVSETGDVVAWTVLEDGESWIYVTDLDVGITAKVTTGTVVDIDSFQSVDLITQDGRVVVLDEYLRILQTGLPVTAVHEGLKAEKFLSSSQMIYSSEQDLTELGDSNGYADVFLFTSNPDELVLVSTNSSGQAGNGNTYFVDAWKYGNTNQTVVFFSEATNLSAEISASGYYVKNLNDGRVDALDHPGYNIHDVKVSGDGTKIAYTASDAGSIDAPKKLFLKDLSTGQVGEVSTNGAGQGQEFSSEAGQTSQGVIQFELYPDGSRVLFITDAINMSSDNTSGTGAYIKYLPSGNVERLSEDLGGQAASADTYAIAATPNFSGMFFVSGDGSLTSADGAGLTLYHRAFDPSGPTSSNDVIDAGAGDDSIWAGGGDDQIDAGSGNDFAYGGAGNDTFLLGSGSDDHFYGEAGEDILKAIGGLSVEDNTTFDGGAGFDTADFSGSTNELIDLWGSDRVIGGLIYGKNHGYSDRMNSIELRDVERVIGTVNSDHIQFQEVSLNLEIHGLDGNDNIATGLGDDIVVAGEGGDWVRTGAGNDIITDEDSYEDYLFGEAGDDRFFVSGAVNTDLIQAGANVVFGGTGNDVLEITGTGSTVAVIGVEKVLGSGYDDFIFGMRPDQVYSRYEGNYTGTYYYSGSDLHGTIEDFEDFIEGRGGNDTIGGADGDDILDGGEGDDELDGEDGADALYGGYGNDELIGGLGADSLFGGVGVDTMRGGDGNDVLDGEQDNDVLYGGRGLDWLYGGYGNDLIFGDHDTDALFGEDGDDQLFGGDGADSLDGGEGRDELDGGAGVDWLYGGAGDDTLRGGLDGDALFGDAGTDSLYGDDGNDSLDGGEGQDVLSGGSGDDWLFGQAREDWLFGDEGSDVLFGGTHDDRLDGGTGGDSLDGGSGDDILIGGAGIDVLFGGSGFDRFRYYSPEEGGDVIRDFFAAEDGFQILSSNFGFGYTGALRADDFTSGAGLPFDLESGAGPKFYFETETRGLWFDPTGGTTEDIVIVAGLETGLVTADDIVLI